MTLVHRLLDLFVLHVASDDYWNLRKKEREFICWFAAVFSIILSLGYTLILKEVTLLDMLLYFIQSAILSVVAAFVSADVDKIVIRQIMYWWVSSIVVIESALFFKEDFSGLLEENKRRDYDFDLF